jgi:hypothetical protein
MRNFRVTHVLLLLLSYLLGSFLPLLLFLLHTNFCLPSSFFIFSLLLPLLCLGFFGWLLPLLVVMAVAVVLLILLLLPEPGVLLFSVAVAAVAEQFVAGAGVGAGVGVAVADLGTLGVIVLEPCCSCWSVGTIIVDAGSVGDIASFDP